MISRICLALLTSLIVTGCVSTDFNKMLDRTADYDGKLHAEETLKTSSGPVFGPKRVEAKLTDVYIFPHEMGNGDYFMGGWVRTVVSHAYWKNTKPTFPKEEKSKKPSKQHSGSRP